MYLLVQDFLHWCLVCHYFTVYLWCFSVMSVFKQINDWLSDWWLRRGDWEFVAAAILLYRLDVCMWEETWYQARAWRQLPSQICCATHPKNSLAPQIVAGYMHTWYRIEDIDIVRETLIAPRRLLLVLFTSNCKPLLFGFSCGGMLSGPLAFLTFNSM